MVCQEKYNKAKKSKEAIIKTISEIEVIASDLVKDLAETSIILHSIKKEKKHDNKDLESQSK